MNNFLKELMTLATELNKAEGFNALTVINDMELLYDRHVAELKNLAIHDVSNRRELLIAFFDIATEDDIKECVNGFAGRVSDRLESNLLLLTVCKYETCQHKV